MVPGQGSATPHDVHDPYPYGHTSWWGKALILVIVILPLVALAGIIAGLWGARVGGLELGLLLGLWALTGLGISVGFHRMLTHRAFSAGPVTRFALLLAGTLALEGPPAAWAATHLRHHAKADRDGDPHSPLEGFWHAHFGWMLRDRMVQGGTAMERLMEDPVVAWLSRTWILWTVVSLALPAAIGYVVRGTLLGALECFIWGGLVRVALLHHTTWSVNSVGHLFGTRPLQTPDLAANNVLVALRGWGEGWHNNRHAFPRSAFMGLHWWQVDPGGWLIRVLRAMGLVTRVWRPRRSDILARMRARTRG